MSVPFVRSLSTAAVGALILSACASERFAGLGSPRVAAPPPAAAPALEPTQPRVPPAGPVTSEPLPPPSVPGLSSPPSSAAPAAPGTTPLPGSTPTTAAAPATPGTLNPTPPATPPKPEEKPAPRVTTAEPAGSATRSSLTGSWNARDGAGGSCKVQLSSAPALDLYKAAAAGCPNRDLARVNAWEYRDGEIYLYAAGAVVARLQAQGSRTASGALVRSGAPVTFTR
jgi:hypothetical protein